MDYEKRYALGYEEALENVVSCITKNLYRFGVDTSDTEQVDDFWDKLGFDPYTKEPK